MRGVQGRENAKLFLNEHPEVMVELNERVRQQVGLSEPMDAPGAKGTGEVEPIPLRPNS